MYCENVDKTVMMHCDGLDFSDKDACVTPVACHDAKEL
jgi:hypothetical protein